MIPPFPYQGNPLVDFLLYETPFDKKEKGTMYTTKQEQKKLLKYEKPERVPLQYPQVFSTSDGSYLHINKVYGNVVIVIKQNPRERPPLHNMGIGSLRQLSVALAELADYLEGKQ